MDRRLKFILQAIFLLTLIEINLVACQEYDEDPNFLYDTFPSEFRWGFATASYQIEGAWNVDGKGENIWDEFTHREPSPIYDNSTGDDACKSYTMYPQDVALLENMGAQIYRFSISWSRVLPNGKYEKPEDINELGVAYYNNLIDLLLEKNITPLATIYHWDLPQPLMEIGGWLNEELIGHFKNYSRLVYDRFGGRVKEWITFNEPYVICVEGYSAGAMAPGLKYTKEAPYRCAHTIIKSHAEAYRLYEQEFKAEQNGRVGITIDTGYYQPADPTNASHVEAAERAQQFKHGWFAWPLYFGQYPQIMIDQVARKSAEEGLSYSRLPTFTDEWIQKINGSTDFLGLNHYTTSLTRPPHPSDDPIPIGWFNDQDAFTYFHDSWPESSANWLRTVPWGFRKLLVWIKETYDNPEVIVTENGFADYVTTGVNDVERVYYFAHYINNMLKAVKNDSCNVSGYTAWSLLDNFEWYRGYTQRYGTHAVDFDNENRPRTPKQSANLLKEIFANNGFPDVDYIPPTLSPPPTTEPTIEATTSGVSKMKLTTIHNISFIMSSFVLCSFAYLF